MGHKNAYFLVNGVRCNLLFVSSQIPKSNGEDKMDRNNLRWRKNTLRALVPQIRSLQCWGAVHVGVTESLPEWNAVIKPGRVQGLILLLIPNLMLLVLTGRKQMALPRGFNWD